MENRSRPPARMRATAFAGSAVIALGLFGGALPAAAEEVPAGPADRPGPQLEELGRGLVAVTADGGVHLSWRLLFWPEPQALRVHRLWLRRLWKL